MQQRKIPARKMMLEFLKNLKENEKKRQAKIGYSKHYFIYNV